MKTPFFLSFQTIGYKATPSTKGFENFCVRGYMVASKISFFFYSNHIYFKFIYLFIYGCVGSSFFFCARAFSSCGKRGPLLIAMRGPLTIAASLAAEHRLQTRRLSSCGSRA